MANTLRGKFIVIDGPDGAGKSTQLKLLAEYLREQGIDTRETRDPGGTVIGDKIRGILLDNAHTEMAIPCEILLYMASRAQLMEQVILPALHAEKCVLCDRWVSSTISYQVAGGGATAQEIVDIYDVALKRTWPDLTIILDLPSEAGLSRITRSHDRMEAKGDTFHRRVRELFLKQAKENPSRMVVVPAIGGIDEIQQQLRQCLLQWSFEGAA